MSERKEQALLEYNARLSIFKAIPMGLQHVVATVVEIVTPGTTTAKVCQLSPSDAATLIRTSLIFSAVATLIQLFPTFGKAGSRLPVMMGTSFTYAPILMAIGADFRIAAIFGSQLVDDILVIIVGLFIKKIRVLFPPLVTGTIISGTELSLFPVAIKYTAGGAGSADFDLTRNWLVALLAFVIVFYFNHPAKGLLKLSAILNGMVIGYSVSLALGMVSFGPVQNAKIVQVITPSHFELDFQLVPIFTPVAMLIADAARAIGRFVATTIGIMDRDVTDEELPGGIVGNGFTNSIGSLFGSTPVAAFGQNTGLVTVIKVINKYVLVFASVILLIAGFVPKIAALLTTIPYAAIGSATISAFASISMTGTRMVTSREVTPRNTEVVGTALAFGIGVTLSAGSLAGLPIWITAIFGNSEVILATLVAILLNVILKSKKCVALE